MAIKINIHFLTDIINSISYYDFDECDLLFARLDGNDEYEMKLIIRYNLYINYLFKPDKYKKIFKPTLQYYLTTEIVDFESIFNDAMVSFDCTKKPKTFFIWIWEVFFEGEDYLISENELSNYIISNEDSNMPHEYSIHPKVKFH